jgi:hypothetical protein
MAQPPAATGQDAIPQAEIAQWIQDLQAKEYTRREAATKSLSQIEFGRLTEVLPLLTAADAEVAWRAREIVVQQGVRGDAQAVRRIGLMFKLLTAAGRTEFRLDAENFSAWVESVRVGDLLQKLQRVDGLQMTEGLRFVGQGMGGNLLRIQGVGGIFIAPNDAPPELFIRGLQGPLAKPRPVDGERAEVEQTDPERTSSEEQGGRPTDPNSPPLTEAEQRQAAVRDQLPVWLQQCITAADEQFDTLETTLKDAGLIPTESLVVEGMVTHYEIWVTRPLAAADLAVFADFLKNRVSISLVLTEIPLDDDWQRLISDAAEANKIQMLNTVKCVYDLSVYRELNRLTKAGKLGYWNAQGRAMLGIRASNLALDRMGGGDQGGAEVGDVTPNSAAEIAGIVTGDVITRVNETPVENFEELRKIISAFDVGQSIQVTVSRPGLPQPRQLEVRLMQHAQ